MHQHVASPDPGPVDEIVGLRHELDQILPRGVAGADQQVALVLEHLAGAVVHGEDVSDAVALKLPGVLGVLQVAHKQARQHLGMKIKTFRGRDMEKGDIFGRYH